MSKQVKGVAEKIEACAKQEFLEKGYMDASLRTIAAEAGTTTGTIYSRYGGKEELFSAIVEPVAEEFIQMFENVQKEFQESEAETQMERMDDYTLDSMMQMVEYMYDHLEAFQLLVSNAYGTKFQNFVEHLVEIETEYTYIFMETLGIKFKSGKPMTKEFMHIMNKAFFESFFEVIRHNISKEEAMEYMQLLEKYHIASWNIVYEQCT